MCTAGVMLAAASLLWPNLSLGYASFGILLGVSFVADLAIMQIARRSGEVIPVSMEARFAGFFAGMILYLAITGLLGAPTV